MYVRLLATLMCVVLFCSNIAFAWNVRSFSKDEDICAALRLLNRIGADEVFENLQENSVKIIFYDLSMIKYSYCNHYAINSVDNWGCRYILINSKYRGASKEELACLIAHESFHKSKRATLEEETLATEKEAYYWSILKIPGKRYSKTALTNRLDRLAGLYSESTNDNNLIEQRISNSRFYQNQLAVSSRSRF
ncbi:hypothetical protein J6O48_07215 [bacterium]|nr:hypothetical protein [bacterium]